MGEEWLTKITQILAKAGIASGEEYASAPAQAISQPVAAVGLRGLDWGDGKATVSVRILSPRVKGGWACQTTAAKAITALEEAHVCARMEPMEYLPGCDCFQVLIIGILQIRTEEPVEPVPRAWQITIGGILVPYATEFSEEQDLKRRMVGSIGQMLPEHVSPGCGGWEIRLVQKIPAGIAEQNFGPEPMELRVTRDTRSICYTNCFWNQTGRKFSDGTLTVELRGFALGRREEING